jgi:hypothetical protein
MTSLTLDLATSCIAMSGHDAMRLRQWLGDGHGTPWRPSGPATREAGSSSMSSGPPGRWSTAGVRGSGRRLGGNHHDGPRLVPTHAAHGGRRLQAESPWARHRRREAAVTDTAIVMEGVLAGHPARHLGDRPGAYVGDLLRASLGEQGAGPVRRPRGHGRHQRDAGVVLHGGVDPDGFGAHGHADARRRPALSQLLRIRTVPHHEVRQPRAARRWRRVCVDGRSNHPRHDAAGDPGGRAPATTWRASPGSPASASPGARPRVDPTSAVGKPGRGKPRRGRRHHHRGDDPETHPKT